MSEFNILFPMPDGKRNAAHEFVKFGHALDTMKNIEGLNATKND